ncbi:MAG: AbrB/MazE/SpoVT family DNA-binding domain-containing protein [Candidatus Nanohalobium sp.]
MTSVTGKGQVTIPKDIRERAGIKPGDDLQFKLVDGELKVEKKVEENPFSEWRGSLDTDKSTDEIMEELRGD